VIESDIDIKVITNQEHGIYADDTQGQPKSGHLELSYYEVKLNSLDLTKDMAVCFLNDENPQTKVDVSD